MKYHVIDKQSYKLHLINTNKFKTISVKVVFSDVVKREEITFKNFLSDILVFSTKNYNTRKLLQIKQQDLYAMNIFSSCYRLGKLYNMDISASFLNDKYTEEGNTIECFKLLSEVIFNPNINNFSFDEDSFNIVNEMTFNQINSVKEDTRKLSLIKMLENMGNNEIYSYHGYGYLDDLNKINRENLYEYYKDVLTTNKVDIFVLGDIDEEKIIEIVDKYFKFKTIKNKKDDFIISHDKYRKYSKKVVDQANITQSKLSIGCKLTNLTKYESNYVLPLYSTILGGGSDSKLFKEVREANSLCYYISSSSNKLDNILFITSGISYSNFDKTIKLIKKTIKDISLGKYTEDDINNSKIQYITMLEQLLENPFQIISSYYSMELLQNDDIETRIKKINDVTYDEIKELSKKVHLDTIYLLKGAE